MKMSLCNGCRSFVVSCIVLFLIDTPAAFTLPRPTGRNDVLDMAQEESVILEVKHDLKRPNDLRTDSYKNVNTLTSIDDADSSTTQLRTDMTMASSSEKVVSIYEMIGTRTEISTPTSYTEPTSTENSGTHSSVGNIESTTLYMSTESSTLTIDTEPFPENNTTITSNSESSENTSIKSINTLQEPKTVRIYKVTKPSWKKYTTIERIRSTIVTPSDLALDETDNYKKNHNIENIETKHQRSTTLQDASDIASLEKLKIDLLLTTQKQQHQASENKFSRLFSTEHTMIDESTSNILTITGELPTTEINNITSISSESRYTVESKRAGYLDFSGKSTGEDVKITTAIPHVEVHNDKEILTLNFEGEKQTDGPNEKTGLRIESQSQLNEDALKEELLKEDILIDNAENAKRFRDDSLTPSEMTLSSERQINNKQGNFQNGSLIDDKLKVKPINVNSEKNTILYPVSPNYKPLKKLDVKPPKVFIRDPDDISWRNESLSSLGIVFKSKNSSKPFTQVLKNKTESELNKLVEKEEKNDIPELRERLQKIAEIRKSKKNRTDSLGNVYFDYEEGSGEKVNSSKEETVMVENVKPPDVASTVNTSYGSSEQTSDINTTKTTTTERSIIKEFDVPSTGKSKQLFNVLEYYDNTEEDDTDYLNMAKIDIKKYSTTKITSTTPKIRDWSRPRVLDKQTSIISPNRKGTVQYFPPLTTQKVNFNDYDTDFKFKVNSFTTVSEQPKHVLPVSTSGPTKQTQRTKIQHNEYKNPLVEYTPVPRPNIDKDLYLTKPPSTTEQFTELGDGRDGYVIKHYRDFMNQAAKDEEYDKNIDYSYITEAPIRGVTKTDFNTHEEEKPRINMGDDYDYETQFRKDVLQRFVDNFNQNSHRFKSDFPILFNNSVIHGEASNGRDIASSRAFMRGLYENRLRSRSRPCEPHCDNITVELSPAYELHYYVPEQEERQEAPPATVQYHM